MALARYAVEDCSVLARLGLRRCAAGPLDEPARAARKT